MTNEAFMGDHSWNSSYVYAVDHMSGWGGRYFFTYFSEFNPAHNGHYFLELTVLIFTFIVSLFANVSIIICVSRYPEMKTVTNCFVLNLAISDILFALTIPVVAYTRVTQSWTLGDTTCRIIPYVQFVSGIVLLWTLAFISIDRHRCIVIPPYRSNLSPSQANFTSLLIWLTISLAVVPVALWFREIHTEEGQTICTLVFPRSEAVNYSIVFIVTVVFFACLLPMALLVYHYQQIFQKILSTKNAWSTSCVVISAVELKGCSRTQTRRQSELSMSDIFVPWPRKFSTQMGSNGTSSRHGSLSTQEELRLNKHIKVVRILFLNVIVVLVMWLPITLVMILIHIDGRRENDDHNYFLRSHHFLAALSVALLNTVINPLLYGVLSDNFRACLLKIWCRRRGVILDTATPSSGRQNGKCKRPSASLSEKSERSDRTEVDRKLGMGLI